MQANYLLSNFFELRRHSRTITGSFGALLINHEEAGTSKQMSVRVQSTSAQGQDTTVTSSWAAALLSNTADVV